MTLSKFFIQCRQSAGISAFGITLVALAAGCSGQGGDMTGVDRVNFRVNVTDNGEPLSGSQQGTLYVQAMDAYTGDQVAIDPQPITLVLGSGLVVKTLEQKYKNLDPTTFDVKIKVGENGLAQCGMQDYSESGDGTTITVIYACDLSSAASTTAMLDATGIMGLRSHRVGESRGDRMALLQTDNDLGRQFNMSDAVSGVWTDANAAI
jgi:hypothetical protein